MTSIYDGFVGTRGYAPSQKSAFTQAMARTAFFTRSAVDHLDIMIANWHGAEVPTGASMSVNIAVEDPAGNVSSVVSATIPSGAQTKLRVPVTLAANVMPWFRGYFQCSAGIPIGGFQGQNLSLGDALILGNSGVADQTGGGTVTDGGTFISIAPMAIIGPTSLPSCLILGDSIAAGVNNDHTPNSNGDSGIIAPSIAQLFGYSNMGVNADSASAFVSSHTNRAALLQYCSHLFVEYGTNDIELVGSSVAQLQADLSTIYGLAAPGTTIFQNTLLPRTVALDGQSNPVPSESKRVAFNAALRAGTFGPNGGYFDPEPVVGTGPNNSLWQLNDTNDGVHPSTAAYYTKLQGGYIDRSRIYR